MIFRAKGIPLHIDELIVGIITRDVNARGENYIYIADSLERPLDFAAVLSTAEIITAIPCVTHISSLDHLEEGDIVSIGVDGNIRTVYRVNSYYNSILVTERCNSNCLMCSQPPKDKNDIPYLYDLYSRVIPLIPKDCIELTISGGEPTLMGELFFNLLELITVELPNTEVHVLTNGRSFAWEHMAERLASQ
jgi:sulfatase maturation enzyme AslB (radical SAM superfamily)